MAQDGPPQQDSGNDYVGDQDIDPAVVTIGEINITDQDSVYTDLDNGVWTDYYVMNRYEHDHHIYMMPICSPTKFQGNSTAFVQLAAPTLLWIADWTAERAGAQPTMPTPLPPSSNWILMDDHYEPAMLTIASDGITPVWRISGTYVYGNLNGEEAGPSYPRAPWMTDSFDRCVDVNMFADRIKDSGSDCDGSSGTLQQIDEASGAGLGGSPSPGSSGSQGSPDPNSSGSGAYPQD